MFVQDENADTIADQRFSFFARATSSRTRFFMIDSDIALFARACSPACARIDGIARSISSSFGSVMPPPSPLRARSPARSYRISRIHPRTRRETRSLANGSEFAGKSGKERFPPRIPISRRIASSFWPRFLRVADLAGALETRSPT